MHFVDFGRRSQMSPSSIEPASVHQKNGPSEAQLLELYRKPDKFRTPCALGFSGTTASAPDTSGMLKRKDMIS